MSELQNSQKEIIKRLMTLEISIQLQNLDAVQRQINWFKHRFGHNWKLKVLTYVADTLQSGILSAPNEE